MRSRGVWGASPPAEAQGAAVAGTDADVAPLTALGEISSEAPRKIPRAGLHEY